MKYFEQAKARIEKEKSNFSNISTHGKAVMPYVAEKLIDFAGQDDEFAQAIVQAKGSLAECCTEAVKQVKGNYISDIEVYQRAVRFYFPGADVRMELTIDLCGGQSGAERTPHKGAIVLDLSDFL